MSNMRVHAGRALIEESKRFSHQGKAINEYIKNSFQYTDGPVVVELKISKNLRNIKIKDNGRGLSLDRIENGFLVLHGENEERLQGGFGRGEYGTGKIAGLGIGDVISVRTVHNKLLNHFEIHREACLGDAENHIPIKWLSKNTKVDEKNGTEVEIRDTIEKLNKKTIKEFTVTKTLIEKVYPQPHTIYLDNEKLEKEEIPFVSEEIHYPTEEQKKIFGEAKLIIKIATRKLIEYHSGITIFCRGINKAFEKNANGPKCEFIFGEAHCDKLIDESIRPAIFDSSRNEKMNLESPIAQAFQKFIAIKVDQTRKKLEEEDNQRRQKKRDEILEKEKLKMQELFNKHYKEQEIEFQKQVAKARGNIDEKENIDARLGSTKIIKGDEFNVSISSEDGLAGIAKDFPNGPDREKPSLNDDGKPKGGNLKKEENTENKGKLKQTNKKTSGGGFSFDFQNLGIDEDRAEYKEIDRQIIINLDHPLIQRYEVLANNQRGNPKFLRQVWEAVAYEYARVITTQKGSSNMIENDLIDGIESLNEVYEEIIRKIAAMPEMFKDD